MSDSPKAGRMQGRVAIVTGASSGIGEAAARSIAAEGATVALAARRRERLEALQADIEAAGGTALVHPTDVTDLASVRALAAATAGAFGRIDVLVNNAGVMPISPVEALHVDEWDRMIDVNVKGVLHGIAAVLPTMIGQRSGHIVNIGSLAGRRPFPGGSVYSATKFAVRSLSWGLHLELGAKHGIRVTDLQPGVVRTELMDHIPDEAIRDGFAAAWEDKRPLEPEDVARAIVFALTAPEHVVVNELLVRPVDQPT